MQEMIDITDFLDHIYVDMEQFLKFQKRCHLDDMECTEIIQQVIRQTIAETGNCSTSITKKNALIEESSRFDLVQKGKQADVALLKVDVELEQADALEISTYMKMMGVTESEFMTEALMTFKQILRDNPLMLRKKRLD